MRKTTLIALLTLLTACSQAPETITEFDASSLIQGELSAQSYVKAATTLVDAASQAVSSAELSEKELNQHIAKVEAMLQLARDLEQENPYRAELLSTLGSMYAKKSVFYSNNAKQAGSLAAKGFRYLDKAVSGYPNNITARINRGIVSARVPEFLNKTNVAISDLSFVVNNPDFSALSQPLQQSIHGMLAELNTRVKHEF